MTLAVALAVGATPALAQRGERHGGGGGRGDGNRGGQVSRSRGEGPRGPATSARPRQVDGGRSQRGSAVPRADARRDRGPVSTARRPDGRVYSAPRVYRDTRAYRGDTRVYRDSRLYRGPAYRSDRYGRVYGRSYARPSYGRGYYSRGYRGPIVHVRSIRPFRGAWFNFRPRLSLGFGLFVGYPVAYPWAYVTPYPYPYAYSPYPYAYPPPAPYPPPYGYGYGYGSAAPANPYGPYAPAPGAYAADPNGPYQDDEPYDVEAYPGPNPNAAAPNTLAPADQAAADQRNVGGVSLDIDPRDATVFVDGADAGTVANFTSSSAPLTLTPGRHRIEIRKPGYRTMTIDADITAGQVIPYRGTMERQ